MIKLGRGIYIHFSVGVVFLIAFLSGTFEITLMAFLTALCHEFCHLFAALMFKENCRGIAFMPYGCRLYIKESKSGVKAFFIAAAGPLFNIISALIIKEGPLYDINIAMALINLFPVMPLDGGRMVYSLLSIVKGPFFAISVMRYVSFSGGAVLALLGIYQAIATGFNLSVFTAGAFLLFSAICQNGRERLYMGVFTEGGKLRTGVKKGRIIAAEENLPARKILPLISPSGYTIVKVIASDGKIKSEITEDEVKEKILSLGAGVRLREIT